MTRQLVRAFPMPLRPHLRAAYEDLYLVTSGDEKTKRRIGNPAGLPRPWDPPTCKSPELRRELWDWLDQVVDWFNTEYVWDPAGGALIPPCWPLHPHLVHEIAALADQRRRASIDTASNSLEEWHRYTVPAFTDRLKLRTRSLCEEEHKPWPGRARQNRYSGAAAAQERRAAFDADIANLSRGPIERPKLRIVDDDGHEIDAVTGEVHLD
ncbi:MAG TPA: hypothetical protein VGK53_11165 [Propionicimonas sp.]